METNPQITIPIPIEKVFTLEEHEQFKPEHLPYIASLGLDFVETDYEGTPRYLGITPDFKASYYIGADWLTDNTAVIVTPKMHDIDHISMFVTALKFAHSSSYFAKFYGIDFTKPKIESEKLDGILTPLMLIHFLSVIQKLLEKGLKKGYVSRDENLHAKIKGKVMMSQQFCKNIANKRKDKVMCCYQEYSADIPENRLLKKALLFVKRSVGNMPALQAHKEFSSLNRMLNSSLAAFASVSDDIDIGSVRNVQKNKLFGNYGEAIRLAKMVLKRYDYSINNVEDEKNHVPPFWIDMARLYEVYVYSLLQAAYPGQIKFQVKGHYKTAVDFLKLDEELIMDTKYKPHYESSNGGIIDDIREISGYARDEYILDELGVKYKDAVPDCLIIYPKMEDCCRITAFHEGAQLIPVSTQIQSFRKFHKICVPVPKLSRE